MVEADWRISAWWFVSVQIAIRLSFWFVFLFYLISFCDRVVDCYLHVRVYIVSLMLTIGCHVCNLNFKFRNWPHVPSTPRHLFLSADLPAIRLSLFCIRPPFPIPTPSIWIPYLTRRVARRCDHAGFGTCKSRGIQCRQRLRSQLAVASLSYE